MVIFLDGGQGGIFAGAIFLFFFGIACLGPLL
jgi:hypothetical protein